MQHEENAPVENTSTLELKLLPLFDLSLTKPPENFDFATPIIDPEELSLALFKKMLELKTVGLSANQVGIDAKVFVIGNEDTHLVLFNPLIVSYSPDKVPFEESCVSMPGFRLVLQRPSWVIVSYQDVTGAFHTARFDGIAARIILHEYDHMIGMNFTMHASNMKLHRELKKWMKRNKKNYIRKA